MRYASIFILASLLLLSLPDPAAAQRSFRSSRIYGGSRGGDSSSPGGDSPGTPLAQPGGPPSAASSSGEKPPETRAEPKSDKDKEGEKKSEVKPDDSSVTKRSAKPGDVPRPEELKLRPGPDGKIRFDFRGQPWPDVLQWLADVSGLSLDWQELPGDYLNLTTQRGYSVEESRDLINRHLLSRGFTLLLQDDVLTVMKTDKINVALVPRVEAEDLANRLPYEFVKVSFPLKSLVAEQAVTELKPLISSNGQLTALKTTNRIEAMDAVINLRGLHALLQHEQSGKGEERLVREFVLRHSRADEVHEQLQGLLGIESSKGGTQPGPGNQDQMQMMQRMMAFRQMREGGGGPPGGPGGPGGADSRQKTEVHMVVNTRRNSILAQATPDKMAIIAKAVETIDVPIGQDRGGILTNVNRMQVYRLETLDPETLTKTLQDAGDLEPTTQLQVDKKHKSIIAYASMVDHLTIRTLVKKLDGSSRNFEVLKLHRLAADYVAGSITFMMGQEEPKDDRSRSSGYGWSPWGGGGSDRRSSEDISQDKMRVEADVENNRLLLWVNEVEMGEIRNLLVKLGEISGPGGNPERVRVLDLEPGETTQQLLERIRRTWPSLAPNKLVLPPVMPPPVKSGEATAPSQEKPPLPAPSPTDRQADRSFPDGVLFRFAQLDMADADGSDSGPPAPATPAPATPAPATPAPATPAPATPVTPDSSLVLPSNPMPDANLQNPSQQPNRSLDSRSDAPAESQEPPPIHISIGEDGRLMISSQDTGALDALEELIRQVGTPRKDHRQFTLQYMSAYTAKLNLEDYFKEDKKESTTTSRRSWFSEPPAPEPKQANRLSKRKQMKFIEDTGTNTLLVVGGTAEQLANVEELINMWDVPPPKDSESARITTVVPIRYSHAQTVAETVKEVYRDLLSSTDKALQGADAGRPQAQNTYIFGDTGGGASERRTKVSFKGKLSIGVDEVSNTLIVSTEGQNLMENVQKMIESLDVAAIPTTDVQVVTLKGGMNPDSVREALAKILGQTSSGSSSAGMQGMSGMSGAGRRGGAMGGTARGGTGGSGRGGAGGTGGGSRGGGGGGFGGSGGRGGGGRGGGR